MWAEEEDEAAAFARSKERRGESFGVGRSVSLLEVLLSLEPLLISGEEEG